ncbi:hypothetical protein [uncultured Bacteroides sp.]|jgi:hypothetical protein|uniref:hypothetical protein n=1 Tax=uncultured Bacteroides sp. TaxID=162156 RepID=UPI00280B6237|nr:hypothetical protein [uncultured Bacteroides sp.]
MVLEGLLIDKNEAVTGFVDRTEYEKIVIPTDRQAESPSWASLWLEPDSCFTCGCSNDNSLRNRYPISEADLHLPDLFFTKFG